MTRCCAVRWGVIFVAALWAAPALAVTCQDVVFEKTPYTICEVSPDEDLRLWLAEPDGNVLGSVRAIESTLDGGQLSFTMNAGMYHDDRQPVGLYIENGREITPEEDGGGYGNYGLLPNGIFCISDTLRVWESDAYAAAQPGCTFATQSGPMLVIDGELHPKLLADSTSRFIRNGVGTSADGQRAVFAISNRPVNFYNFARFYRDYLELPDALFLDANVSRLHAPALNRADGGFAVGPIVGVVDDKASGG